MSCPQTVHDVLAPNREKAAFFFPLLICGALTSRRYVVKELEPRTFSGQVNTDTRVMVHHARILAEEWKNR